MKNINVLLILKIALQIRYKLNDKGMFYDGQKKR